MKTYKSKDLLKLFDNYVTSADLKSAIVLSDISLAIASKREELAMTQKEFAKYMGVSQSMVSKWEDGAYNFTIEKICEIFDKLKMDFDFSIKGSDSQSAFHLRETENTNNTERKIIDFSSLAYASWSLTGGK